MTFFLTGMIVKESFLFMKVSSWTFGNCPSCAQPTYGENQQIKGSFITVTQDCGFCAFQRTWSSQPFIGSIPAGNFELSCALLFLGSLPSKATRMFQFLNMASISYRTVMYHQQCYLHPVVSECGETSKHRTCKKHRIQVDMFILVVMVVMEGQTHMAIVINSEVTPLWTLKRTWWLICSSYR